MLTPVFRPAYSVGSSIEDSTPKEILMPNIASIIRDHVVLSTRCLDRLYINGYMPKLQSSGQLAYFMTEQLGKPIPSPALLRPLHDRFVEAMGSFAAAGEIPLVRFARRQRKDEVAGKRRRAFRDLEGVVFIGVAQERMSSFKAQRCRTPNGSFTFDFSRQPVYVNHYYFYFQDRDWGPGFLKVGSYVPHPVKLCLNGHEWAKQQLRRQGIGFESLDNGFLSCEDPDQLQAICDGLGPEDVQSCFDRWSHTVPWPLLDVHRAAGYEHRLSIWQVESSLTQVFDRPLYGRQFFEEVIREHMDLGRPDRVSALFAQRLTSAHRLPRAATRPGSLSPGSNPRFTSISSTPMSSSTSKGNGRYAPRPRSTIPGMSRRSRHYATCLTYARWVKPSTSACSTPRRSATTAR